MPFSRSLSHGSTTRSKLTFAALLVAGSSMAAACGEDPADDAVGGGGSGSGATDSSGGTNGTGGSTGEGATDQGGSGDGGGVSPVGGGGSGGGTQCTPEDTFDGEPVTGEAGEWVWVDVPDALCRDGSPAGFGVRLNPASDKLFIYFEGGGACFNGTSCNFNASSFGSSNFSNWRGGGGHSGLFDSENPDNPVRDWNAIFIPYCTGDVHAGNAPDSDVPGFGSPQGQAFVGYRNVGLFLDRIIPTFPTISKVLVTGSSAGGFGATYNYDRIAQAFCPKPAVLIDDSGPAMSDEYLTPCLQTRWRELWGLNSTLPADCPECAGADGGGIVNYVTYLGNKYPDTHLGLLSSDQDNTIRLFFGYGENNCANIDGAIPVSMSGQKFAEGLDDVRDNYLTGLPAWSSYFVESTTHTYLAGSGYADTTVDRVPLTDWITAIIDGGEPGHVGP
ncbi:MAG: hypothetical protein HOW73_22450 [Polyangiaceae bacterium]|nr:hypothetical protein [Polyangiaceae bacterium]